MVVLPGSGNGGRVPWAFMNPTIARVTVRGRDALVVSLYIPGEGARGAEAGELIFYRLLEDS